MLSLIIAVVAGAFVAFVSRPVRAEKTLAAAPVALVGSFGGALVGAVAGTALVGLVVGPWVGLGVLVGSFTGAAAAVVIDQRLQPIAA